MVAGWPCASTYCCATIASGAYNRGHRLMNHASSDGEPTATSHWLDIVRARRSARIDLIDLIDQRTENYPWPTTNRRAKPRPLSQRVDESAAVNNLASPICGDGCHAAFDIEIKPSTSWFNPMPTPRRRAEQ